MQQIRMVSILYTLCTDKITPQAARQEIIRPVYFYYTFLPLKELKPS